MHIPDNRKSIVTRSLVVKQSIASEPDGSRMCVACGLRQFGESDTRERKDRAQATTHLLSDLDLETGEITFGAWSDPEGYAALGITKFEIIHQSDRADWCH
jgi:hypothetical protein